MQAAFTVDKIREIEADLMEVEGDDVLMQRAAAGVARCASEMLTERRGRVYGTRVVIVVGAGNNGGDALFAGVRLARRGAQVSVISALGEPHLAGATALSKAGGRFVTAENVGFDDSVPTPSADLCIDGMFGIGGRAGLTGEPARLARRMRLSGLPTLAVDLPSGVDADTGAAPDSAVRADRTVSFGGLKPCHFIEPARSRCGRIDLVDIGFGHRGWRAGPDLLALTEHDLAVEWPFPDPAGDKYARGVVGVDTGSDQYPGAGVLSTYGAVYGGAGMVRFLGADRPAEIIRAQLPNVVFGAGRVQAHLFGCGWGDRADGARVLAEALEGGLPAVVDADGLRYLPPRLPETWLLTPHAGELARLLDQERSWVEADPHRAVRAAAEHTGATVLLKGATQLVTRPGPKPARVAVPGPAWTGQAGSGDVLGGLCAALLATGIPAITAAGLGASLQAVTAARHPGPVPPMVLTQHFPDEIARLQRAREDEWSSRP